MLFSARFLCLSFFFPTKMGRKLLKIVDSQQRRVHSFLSIIYKTLRQFGER